MLVPVLWGPNGLNIHGICLKQKRFLKFSQANCYEANAMAVSSSSSLALLCPLLLAHLNSHLIIALAGVVSVFFSVLILLLVVPLFQGRTRFSISSILFRNSMPCP